MSAQASVGDGVATVGVGDTLVALWREPTIPARWVWIMERKRELIATMPDGIIIFDIILPSSTPPNAALRSQMQADLRSLGKKMRHLVVVPLGDGLWQAVVRTIVRGMLLFTGQSRQQSVVNDIAAGLARVEEYRVASTPSAAELHRGIDQVFTALRVPRNSVA